MHDKLIPKKAVAAGCAILSLIILIACLLKQFPMLNIKRHCTPTPFAVHQTMANPLALHHKSMASQAFTFCLVEHTVNLLPYFHITLFSH